MSLSAPVKITVAAALIALLSACSSTGTQGTPAGNSRPSSGGSWFSSSRTSHDPLIDAPNRAVMTCKSESAVTVLQRINETPFACPDLGVSATLDELRDAGWRVTGLNIGEDAESEGHVGFPVTVTVRKLF